MVEIIEENRRPSFLEKLGRGMQEGLPNLLQALQSRHQMSEENKNLKEITGEDLSGLSPDLKKVFLQGFVKKKQEDVAKFTTGLDVISAMREIIDRGNVGRGSAILGFFPGETARDRSELEQLGKSLIPLVAAGVPIRNQKEFEEYRKVITNPSSAISDLQGALNGLERIFHSKIKGDERSQEIKNGKGDFSSKNPEHQAKARQLYKTYKNKEKVREILRKEFEGVDVE